MAMENGKPWPYAVTYVSEDEVLLAQQFPTLDMVVPFMHEHRNDKPLLWEPSRYGLTVTPDAQAAPKRRQRRQRKESPAAAGPRQASNGPPDGAGTSRSITTPRRSRCPRPTTRTRPTSARTCSR